MQFVFLYAELLSQPTPKIVTSHGATKAGAYANTKTRVAKVVFFKKNDPMFGGELARIAS